MSVLYDAGALVAAERSDRDVWAEHRARLERGVLPITTAPVVAQVSRSARQVQLRRFLRGCEVVAFDVGDAHDVGDLIGRAGMADVVDGHVATIASRVGATVLTSDPDDLRRLTSHLAQRIQVRRV